MKALGLIVHTVLVRPSRIRYGRPCLLQGVVTRGEEQSQDLCALINGRR